MQYVQSPTWIQRYFVAVVAVVISLVIATSMPVKALTVQQALIGTAEQIRKNFNATIDATIVALEKNEKQMAALHTKLQDGLNHVVAQTREEINKFIAGAERVRDMANQLAEKALDTLGETLKQGVDAVAKAIAAGNAAALATLDAVINGVDNLMTTGKAIVAEAQKLVDQGRAQLEDLAKNVQQFTAEQLENVRAGINQSIAAAEEVVKNIGGLVTEAGAIVAQGAKSAGAAAADLLKNASALVDKFVKMGTAAAQQAAAEVTKNVEALRDKIKSDIQTVKNAVKVEVGDNGVSAKVDLGKGVVIYAGINLPPEVAESLRDANQKRIAALKKIQAELAAATNPDNIREKIQEAVKQVNDAALASVYARTTKAIDSQITVVEGLQVSANALQTQANQLKQCLEQSSTSDVCKKLRTNENSADQGASLQERIKEIRTNLETLRAFLSATVDLAVILNNENYTGTIASMTSMTNMMHSMSSLTSGTRSDLKNLSNAINV